MTTIYWFSFAVMVLLALLQVRLLGSHIGLIFFFFNDTATTEIYTLSLHDALPIFVAGDRLAAHWRLHSTPQRTPDEWAAAFTAHLTQAGHSTQEIRAAVVASVAP